MLTIYEKVSHRLPKGHEVWFFGSSCYIANSAKENIPTDRHRNYNEKHGVLSYSGLIKSDGPFVVGKIEKDRETIDRAQMLILLHKLVKFRESYEYEPLRRI